MKTILKAMMSLAVTTAFLPITAFASVGTVGGGGGDATEIGVDLIRADILKWIQAGGASTFREWPEGITEAIYVKRIVRFLLPRQVVVGFVTTEQDRAATDPEQKVSVNGNAKSCRGFLSVKDQLPHILCNSDRYPKSAADQYRLIHHEFAGLASVEKNIGAASDYTLSKQLTDSLEPRTEYRLAVKRSAASEPKIIFEYEVRGISDLMPQYRSRNGVYNSTADSKDVRKTQAFYTLDSVFLGCVNIFKSKLDQYSRTPEIRNALIEAFPGAKTIVVQANIGESLGYQGTYYSTDLFGYSDNLGSSRKHGASWLSFSVKGNTFFPAEMTMEAACAETVSESHMKQLLDSAQAYANKRAEASKLQP